MVQEGLILRMSDDQIKAVVELLSSLELVLILGLAVTENVEILPEGVDLIDGV